MYAITARRLCSLLLHPSTTRPSTLLYPAATTTTARHPASLLAFPASQLSRPPVRSFARRSYDGPDEDEPPDDEVEDIKTAEEELEEEEERRQARGPSKAERLRLKEKEKRRQKLAMRERVDNKKDKKEKKSRRGGQRRALLDDFDDDAIDVFDELDADVDVPLDLDLPAASTQQQQQPGPRDELTVGQVETLRASRLKQKKEQLRQRFGAQDDEDDEDELEEEKEGDERPVNAAITAPAIVLIDGAGKRIGLVSTAVALKKARDSRLDIVTLSPPHIQPPICRVVVYGDWLAMEQQKKGNVEPVKRFKTLQIRKLIDRHDLDIKAAAMRRFLRKGHPVRLHYFEKQFDDGDWHDLFTRVAQLVDGVGVCHDLLSKPVAYFEPVRKKKEDDNKQAKKEKQNKQPQPQTKNQLDATAPQKKDGAAAAAAVPAGGESLRVDSKQHAKAGGE